MKIQVSSKNLIKFGFNNGAYRLPIQVIDMIEIGFEEQVVIDKIESTSSAK